MKWLLTDILLQLGSSYFGMDLISKTLHCRAVG